MSLLIELLQDAVIILMVFGMLFLCVMDYLGYFEWMK